MSASKKGKLESECEADKVKGPKSPDWTSGLKRLYDSVVEEPLPDSFKDLLSKLDDAGK